MLALSSACWSGWRQMKGDLPLFNFIFAFILWRIISNPLLKASCYAVDDNLFVAIFPSLGQSPLFFEPGGKWYRLYRSVKSDIINNLGKTGHVSRNREESIRHSGGLIVNTTKRI